MLVGVLVLVLVGVLVGVLVLVLVLVRVAVIVPATHHFTQLHQLEQHVQWCTVVVWSFGCGATRLGTEAAP